MKGRNKSQLLYFITFSLILHLAFFTLPFSLKVKKVQNKTEVYYLSGKGSGEEAIQNTGSVKQKSPVKNKKEQSKRKNKQKTITSIQQKQPKSVPKKNMVSVSVHTPVSELLTSEETVAEIPSPETDELKDISSTLENIPHQESEPQVRQHFGEGALASSTGNSENYLETTFGNADAPQFLHRELPEYPWISKNRGEEGSVDLILHIDAQGNLMNVEVVRATNDFFADAAIEAMKKSTFMPAQKDGRPIASRATMPIRFNLKN